ncbi:ChaN family lipoprotein [Alkalilimnicola ehrlichii]|uniref:ChaN family lipoprotein n=1 Tax=Alkalilimnicola ehrlichii TaxID=351052 RepID=UPI003BA0A1C9
MPEARHPATARRPLLLPLLALLPLLLAACAHSGLPEPAGDTLECPPTGRWIDAEGEVHTTAGLAAEAAGYEVILLGEEHGNRAQHRWQLLTLAAIHSHTPVQAVGLEMLPGDADESLAAWRQSTIGEEDWLRESGWYEHWGHPADGYLPILHYARLEQIRLQGINLDRATHRRLASIDWEEAPEALDEVITPPAAPHPDYRKRLLDALAEHPHGGMMDEARFIRAQVLWDRVMAERLKALRASGPGPVVGLMGRGHMSHGHGVPAQLADLGVERVLTLLPYPVAPDCEPPASDLADALYGLAPEPGTPQRRLRLGIQVGPGEHGLRVVAVNEGSVAEQAGLREGDELVEAAGRPVESHGDLLMILDKAREGFLLPIKINRNGDRKTLLVSFAVSS